MNVGFLVLLIFEQWFLVHLFSVDQKKSLGYRKLGWN